METEAKNIGIALSLVALSSRVKVLETALAPFASVGECWLPFSSEDRSLFVTASDHIRLSNPAVSVGNFRAAAKTLRGV